MCVTQRKFLILLYFIVFNCELCVTQCVNNYVHTDTTTDYNDKRLTNDRPDLSSERAPQIRQDCNFKKKKISGQKSQIGLHTKMNWLTDRQL
jgi:hypothetical protein